MGCFPFANFHFQIGVTVMGFAEHFGQCQDSNHYFWANISENGHSFVPMQPGSIDRKSIPLGSSFGAVFKSFLS